MGYISSEEASSKYCNSLLFTSLKKQYLCEVCSQTFSKLCYLRLHMKYHAHQCSLCPRMYMRQSLLRKHVSRKHKLPKVKSKEAHFKCEICAQNYESKYDYKIHIWMHHRDLYICKKLFCKKEFKTREEYDNHKRNHKFDPCAICGKRVKDLRLHFLSHVKKKYNCKMCNKYFLNYGDLKRHVLIHLKMKPYKCDCGKAFRQKYSLIIHCRTHSVDKPYSCKICDKKFFRSSTLKIHEKKIHGGNEARTFKCDQCEFVTVTQWLLKYHKNLQHNNKLKCEKCSLVLSNKQTLQRHLLIQCEKKSFPCHICTREFSRKCNLTNHLKQFHTNFI